MISAFISRLHAHPYATQSLILLTLIITLAANLYGLVIGVSIVIPHLLYIPIILAAFFYPRRGIAFAVVVSMVYFLMVVAVRPITSPDIISAAARCVVYIFIAHHRLLALGQGQYQGGGAGPGKRGVGEHLQRGN